MEVSGIIVGGVQVNVVDDLAGLGLGNFAMLPFAPRPLRAVAESVILDQRRVRPAGLLNGWICRCFSLGYGIGHRAHHQISASLVSAARKAFPLLLVGIQRISMPVPHLIMAHAQFAGRHRPVAVLAGSPDYTTAPAVLRRAMLLPALVVHETKAVGGVPTATAIDGTRAVEFRRRHSFSVARYKALGNSMAVPVMAHIGRRIAAMSREV